MFIIYKHTFILETLFEKNKRLIFIVLQWRYTDKKYTATEAIIKNYKCSLYKHTFILQTLFEKMKDWYPTYYNDAILTGKVFLCANRKLLLE